MLSSTESSNNGRASGNKYYECMKCVMSGFFCLNELDRQTKWEREICGERYIYRAGKKRKGANLSCDFCHNFLLAQFLVSCEPILIRISGIVYKFRIILCRIETIQFSC